MGAVFRARDLRTQHPVAIKLLLPDAVENPDALFRFEREAQMAATLGHPGIVRIYAFERAEDGTPYLVMELLDGETLEARLARYGALDWSEARRIAFGVGDALRAAHAHGLLHRDLKPANIFLARRGHEEHPVLVDFGLAKRMSSGSGSRLTTSGVVVGTPLYMSPEQARGEALDPRSDLFGLAVVVYEMVTGVPPFFDKTLAEVYARLLNEAAPLASTRAPGRIPAELDAVLHRALANRREERFSDVASFLHALGEVPNDPLRMQLGA
jgi:serine/threonine-protein kinase